MYWMHRLCAVAVVVWAGCGLALGQSFTYQGELVQNGVPVTTAQDLQFTVFTSAAGAISVGSTTTVTNVVPVNGRFTAIVAPGPGVFFGADRWLQVAVRPAGVGGYTILQPRQSVTPAPYAVHSLSERWSEVGSGTVVNDAATSRVYINRSTPVTGADYFAVRTPTSGGSFGGMYIDTESTTGLPFYGYAAGGSVKGWTYMTASDGAWRLNVAGDRLIVTNSGKVGVGMEPSGAELLQVAGTVLSTGTVRAADLAYTAPQTRWLMIGPEAFHAVVSTNPGKFGGEPINDGAYLDASVGAGYITAPVMLPHGATVTEVVFFLVDASSAEAVTGSLLRKPVFFRPTEILATRTSSLLNSDAMAYTTSSIATPVVDNLTYTYFVSGYCSDWQGPSVTAVTGIRIAYTVPAPQ